MKTKILAAEPGWKLVLPEVLENGQERTEDIIGWLIVEAGNGTLIPEIKVLPITVYGVWDDTFTVILKPNGAYYAKGRDFGAEKREYPVRVVDSTRAWEGYANS